MKTIFISIFIIILSLGVVLAQTQRIEGGSITGSQTWNGTILISGDVTLELNSRLLIEPGTQILFAANTDLTRSGKDKTRSELIIHGTLIARGLPGKQILFSSAASGKRMGDWYGIEFLHLKSGSTFEYCVVEYAYTGLSIKNSTIQISNSESRLNYHVGIKAEVKAEPVIKNSILSENGYAGLICELGAKPVLSGNVISMNRIGVVVFSLAQPNLGSLAQNADSNPGQNRIFNNEEYNLYNHSTKPILAENNFWGDEAITAKIFDKTNDPRYGGVDYLPQLKDARQVATSNMLLLAQNAAESVIPSKSLPPDVQKATDRQISTLVDSVPGRDTSMLAVVDSGLAVIDSIGENIFDLNRSLEKAGPLIASNAPPQPNIAEIPVADEAAAKTIDYDRIFMELFLDGGKKDYIHKPRLRITNVLKNVLQVGEIRLRVIVGKNGEVITATVLRGINDILDDAVLNIVKKYKYKPGTVNNQPVRYSTSEVFRFE